jgi:hypothetical protein
MSTEKAPELDAKQEIALTALMNDPNIKRAAEAAGVSERTLHRWLDDPTFIAAYRKARRQAFGVAISLTQKYAPMAVQSLAKIIADPKTPASAKVAAIGNMLKFSRESLGSTTWRRGSKRWRRRRRRMTATGRRRRRGRAHQRSARQAGDQDGATRPVQGMRRPELPADRDRHARVSRWRVRAHDCQPRTARPAVGRRSSFRIVPAVVPTPTGAEA